MPRGDGTGPVGEGPMTGRAAGYCAGYDTPGPAGRPGRGLGLGLGRGLGRGLARGLGLGLGRRGGRGYRNRFYSAGLLSGDRSTTGQTLDAAEEKELLRGESQRLTSVLEHIEQRLAQLGADKK